MKGGRFFAKKNQVDDRDSDYDRAYRRLLESFEKLTERIKRRNGDNRRSRKVRQDSCFRCGEGRNQWSERKRYQFNDYEFCKENFGKRKYTGNHDQRNR